MKLAAQATHPNDSLGWPSIDEIEDKLSSRQDQEKEPLHPFKFVDTNILDIQALLMVKAVTMFDARPEALVVVDTAYVVKDMEGNIGKQDQGLFFAGLLGNDHPQNLLSVG